MHMLAALRQLPRSGWSFGRAGLGVKRPTLPKRCILSFKAVGLGLFTFQLSVLGKPTAKDNVIRQWHLPAYPLID